MENQTENQTESKNTLEELKNIYSDAPEWLKFLEAKHAGLFAVWTALLFALFSTDRFYDLQLFGQIVLVLLACSGILIDTAALTPFLNQQKGLKKYIQKKTYSKYKDCGENSVFYISIFVKTYSTGRNCRSEEIRKYNEILHNRNLGNLDELLCKDYINQIIDISTVGSVKAYLFDIATKYIAIVMGIGFLTVMIA